MQKHSCCSFTQMLVQAGAFQGQQHHDKAAQKIERHKALRRSRRGFGFKQAVLFCRR